MTSEVLKLSGIDKHYVLGDQTLPVLRDINLSVSRGEFLSIMGSSGAGKSTLLNIIGCLDADYSGDYLLDEQAISRSTEADLARIRSKKIGFVFQLFNLIPRLSALRNVELPLIYAGVASRRRKLLASNALQRVQLAGRAHHSPAQLSGGQQQRVAIARALVNDPALLVLDEPTGSLDSSTSHAVMTMLHEISRQGTTLVMVTHDRETARYSSRVVTMKDGRVIHDEAVADNLS